MKVEFAPLNIPLARRLQTAAVLHWLLSFLLFAQVCLGIIVFLIIRNYWFLYLPYLTWLYFDWQTPEQGGRRSEWVRNWAIWRYFKDYFPIHLIKTWDLDPSHNYIFGFHPHGVLVVGAFGNFCTNYSAFKELFPGFTSYLHVLPYWFRCPLFREYLMSSGPVSVSKKSVSHVLSKEGGGNISVIVLGGAEESLDAHPGKFTLFIRQRKGFVKIALTHGAYLVPVFSFGENELFKQVSNPEGSWLRNVQEKLQKIMGFALPLFHARGIFQYNFGLIPYRKPIHTVEMGIPDHLICLLRNLYAGQEATVRTGHGTTDWFQIGKGVRQGCILSPCLLNLYAEYIMRNAGLEETQAGIKIARRNISNLRYADDTTLMAESEEELKSLLMKVKVESETVGLKLNIQKTKIMASGPITSWEIDGETVETVSDFIFLGSKMTADGDCSH
ncbi:2-acylglycerol O-acyltransferase 1 isoform X1 [Bubalus kerabau]|uniref:2-acylglycerol O-acyltransferase 1 isoform X1 n=1 Tax=Bubalus carabanensis TaxID=3119969 RepID=UPI00244EF99C|nr:2-acylglycerol O-acyltransferase 1 isoform X1 [Bubalus carabanensis]